MDEKRRTLLVLPASSYKYRGIGKPMASYVTPSVTALQSTMTRGHAWDNSRKPKSDMGGDFTTSKIDGMYANDSGTYTGWSDYYEYIGREFAYDPRLAVTNAMNLVTPSSLAVLTKMGASAIAKTIPTNPIADTGTFIGELKEGLPKIVGKQLLKSKFKDYRKIGGEYLNIEFGWKPIISDLQKFGDAAVNAEKYIAQLHRDSGKNVRRKYTFPIEQFDSTTTSSNRTSVSQNGFQAYSYCYRNASGATLTTETSVETKTWFSGCYTYHINLGSTMLDKLSRHAAEARKLYGVELTPATVWNLAPWSWAVDWEGNIGDVLHNVSRFSQDGLVLRYGYIMQQKSAVVTYNLNRNGRLNRSPNSDLSLRVYASSKVRRGATPFGFGFDMKALNGRQASILGALGISRGPRRL
jgi:hypothetical protein